jgi:hypothetical protein
MWELYKRASVDEPFKRVLSGPFGCVDDATRFAYRWFYDLVDSGLSGGPVLITVEGPCKPTNPPFLPIYGMPRRQS